MTGKEIKKAFITAHKDYANTLENKNTNTKTCSFCIIARQLYDELESTIIEKRGGPNYYCFLCTMDSKQYGYCCSMSTYVEGPILDTKQKIDAIILRKQFHKRAAEVLELITPNAFVNHMDKIATLLHQIDQEIYYKTQRDKPIFQDSIKITINPDKDK